MQCNLATSSDTSQRRRFVTDLARGRHKDLEPSLRDLAVPKAGWVMQPQSGSVQAELVAFRVTHDGGTMVTLGVVPGQ